MSPAGDRIEGFVVYQDSVGTGESSGVRGVLVSNGEDVVMTDSRGYFALPSPPNNIPIFLTVPAGFKALPNRVADGGWYCHPNLLQSCTTPLMFRLVAAPESEAPVFTFAVLADYQWEPNDTMQRVFSRIASDTAKPSFVVHVGDLFWMIEGAPVALARHYYEAYKQALEQLALPVYNLIGNHDQVSGPAVSPEMPEFGNRLYEEILGPTYYSFDWGEIHFVVLNPFEISNGTQRTRIAERQLCWLQNDLQYQPKDKPLILFSHRAPIQWENERELLAILKGRTILACFAGDWHWDAVFRCPQEPFDTVVTPGPLENMHWMPPGYRIVWVNYRKLQHAYRLLHSEDEIHIVRPAPDSRISGPVDIVVTLHNVLPRSSAPSYSIDGLHWIPFRRARLPNHRIASCRAHWALWRTTVNIKKDITIVLRAAEDSNRNKHLALPLKTSPSPVLWRLKVRQTGDITKRSQPLVVGEFVVLGEDTGVRAFCAESGQTIWEYSEPGPWYGVAATSPSASRAHGGPYVIATSWLGAVVALHLEDGSVLWRWCQEYRCPPSRPGIVGPFAVVGGMKWDGIWGGRLTCLEIQTGRVCWSRNYHRPFFSTPICVGGTLWTSCGDLVYCIDAISGRDVWSYRCQHVSLYGPLVIVSGLLFAPDIDGWVYVLQSTTGLFVDRFLIPRGTGLATDGVTIYAACGVRGFRAYDPLSYRERWCLQRPGTYFAGLPAFRNEDAIVTGSDGNVYLVNKHSGEVVWHYQLGDIGGATVAVGEENGYLVSGDQQLLAFSIPKGLIRRGEN